MNTDDYVSDTNPVSAVDVFVEEVYLVKRGFEGVIPAELAGLLSIPRFS